MSDGPSAAQQQTQILAIKGIPTIFVNVFAKYIANVYIFAIVCNA